MGEWDDAILVGVVARAHGNRGDVIVNSETDFPEDRFGPGARVRTRRKSGEERELEVAAMRIHQGRPVIRFVGVESMDDAEALAGLELRVGEDEPAPELDGAYFHRDLVGCEVVTESGEGIGRVAAVEGDHAASRLVVKGPRGEVLIPFAVALCTVDLGARRITVRPPEGLLDVNGAWR